MPRQKQIGVTLDEKTLKALDAARGTISRSGYIHDIVFFALTDEEDLRGISNFNQK